MLDTSSGRLLKLLYLGTQEVVDGRRWDDLESLSHVAVVGAIREIYASDEFVIQADILSNHSMWPTMTESFWREVG